MGSKQELYNHGGKKMKILHKMRELGTLKQWISEAIGLLMVVGGLGLWLWFAPYVLDMGSGKM